MSGDLISFVGGLNHRLYPIDLKLLHFSYLKSRNFRKVKSFVLKNLVLFELARVSTFQSQHNIEL